MIPDISSFPFVFEGTLVLVLMLDCILGDPYYLPHPVRGIGILSIWAEKITRNVFADEKAAGIGAFSIVFLVATGVVTVIEYLTFLIHPTVFWIFSALFLYFFIAIKDLFVHSRRVFFLLKDNDIKGARKALSAIVGRDTNQLEKEKIVTACVETVAENMVDGITAPLFWAVVFSFLAIFFDIPSLGLAVFGITAYKAINTMDSMYGYTNERYLHFGRYAAKIDDIVNLIPARLSGICVVVCAACLPGYDGRLSRKIFIRDRKNHTSPNAGHTEAAVAGALQIMLGGTSIYFGKEVKKPTIGNPVRHPEEEDILKANKLVFFSSLFFIVIIVVLRIIFLL
ncbi:MAG: cobalamin biosynthesis protein CobD [Desulfobacterales bacterium]|nr:MAG: cobalamin biosynthesis protein CobD [Desulfobacterales bacterium]